MFCAQTNKLRFVISFATVLFSLHVWINFSEARDQSPVLGELKLEGKSIVRLVLRREDNNEREEFRRPEQIIKLPTGKYRLHEVHLEGGYTSRSNNKTIDWITIAADKPAVLKVGAPLKQTVKVQRQGSVLVLNYELLGIGGEKYTSSDRSKPPTFTIYKGDKEIASDKFEFG